MTLRSTFPLLSLLVVMIAALAPTERCAAQGRPAPLGPSTTGASQLSADQMAEVQRYANYYIAILNSQTSTPEQVEDARQELIRPITNIQVSPVFRFEYSKLVTPKLNDAVEQGTLHTAANAMIVASMIGGDRAANFLIDNADLAFQAKWQIRLQASHWVMNLLKGDTIDGRKMLQAADRLRDAALREDNPMVLRYQLLAIDAADHNPISPDDRAKLRATMVDAIVQVIDRQTKGPASDPQPMLEAIAQAISKVRDKFIGTGMTPTERAAIGKQIAPAMGKMLEMIAADWDAGHADEHKQRDYGVIVGLLEGFLPAIDATVRGGTPIKSTMRQAWDGGNKAGFDAELAKWTQAFQQPQYASSR